MIADSTAAATTGHSPTVVWVIGARGLLGSAIVRRIAADPNLIDAAIAPMPWDDPDRLATAASEGISTVIAIADEQDARIAILWCGGRGVTAGTTEQFAAELDQLRTVLGAITAPLAEHGADGRDVIAFASSAGGVYAGAPAPPHTESTPPVPLSPYGEAKLIAEAETRSAAARCGVSSFVGRISNLYGPGQNLDKPQGLISHLARSRFSGQTLSIFMPLDTVRDYFYVDDAAGAMLDAVARTAETPDRIDAMKILASGTPATIGELLGTIRRVSRTRPVVTLGRSAEAERQAVDLRLRSEVWPDLDRRDRTPLPVGIASTFADVLARSTSVSRRG